MKAEMGVLILTGMPGAGKEELVTIALALGYQVRRMGDVVRAEAARNGVPPQAVGEFADGERRRHGYAIWAKRIVPLVG
ncbi:MAG TPA: AAA family ATPase, partial [Methanomassiliicoccales archaeon]|nr:AAA family ATPase [Methanomassiliicoccales archaeon]